VSAARRRPDLLYREQGCWHDYRLARAASRVLRVSASLWRWRRSCWAPVARRRCCHHALRRCQPWRACRA